MSLRGRTIRLISLCLNKPMEKHRLPKRNHNLIHADTAQFSPLSTHSRVESSFWVIRVGHPVGHDGSPIRLGPAGGTRPWMPLLRILLLESPTDLSDLSATDGDVADRAAAGCAEKRWNRCVESFGGLAPGNSANKTGQQSSWSIMFLVATGQV